MIGSEQDGLSARLNGDGLNELDCFTPKNGHASTWNSGG